MGCSQIASKLRILSHPIGEIVVKCESPWCYAQIVCFAESKNRKILLLSDRKNSLKIVSQFRLTNYKRFQFVTPKYFSCFLLGNFQKANLFIYVSVDLLIMTKIKAKRKCEICGKIFKPMTNVMWKHNQYQHNLMCKKHKYTNRGTK